MLSGGPSSVYADGAPQLDPALFDHDVPVFGICYGFQAMAQALGGTVAQTGTSEYGRTELSVDGGKLHSDCPSMQPVWMSHGDAVTDAPDGFDVVATSAGAPVAAFENPARRLAGVQYHPEVLHTPHGQQVLSRFLHDFAGIASTWTPPTSPTSSSNRCAPRSATVTRSAGCPAASTPRWPPPWCIVPSATD